MRGWSSTCCPAMEETELSLLCLCPTSLLRHRDSFATCCRYFTATCRFGTALRTLLKSVNQMFYFRHLHLEMLISLAKCLFKFGYEVHIFSWSVPKCSVTLAEASKRCKAVVAKPTAALHTLGTASYPACFRYLQAVCDVHTGIGGICRGSRKVHKYPNDFGRAAGVRQG